MPKETFFNLTDEKRQKIIDIAIKEFSENVYNAASISKIVRKAEISKGSFYNYFINKKDLYRYLIELATEEKLKSLEGIPAPDPNAQFFDYMRWQFLSTVNFEIRSPHLARITYRAFIEEIPFPEMTEELRRRGTTQFFKQLIAQGLIHGDVAPWIDPDMAAFIFESVFYQFGRYFIRRLDLEEDDFKNNQIHNDDKAQQLLSNLMDILEAGMKRDPDQRQNFLSNG